MPSLGPLWTVVYRGQLNGKRGAEYVRAKTAWEARKQFEFDYPLRDVVTVGSKPVLKHEGPSLPRIGAAPLRINSTRRKELRGLDPYFTPPEAVRALLKLEPSIPGRVWEPACGNGAIAKFFPGCEVSDVADYGFPCRKADYLLGPRPGGVNAIVTNPPFQLAQAFLEKALREVPYVAFLLRINFLESVARMPLFALYPPSRIHIPSRRLPMMHIHGWDGPLASSNTCHPWFIWDRRSVDRTQLNWYDWQEIGKEPK